MGRPKINIIYTVSSSVVHYRGPETGVRDSRGNRHWGNFAEARNFKAALRLANKMARRTGCLPSDFDIDFSTAKSRRKRMCQRFHPIPGLDFNPADYEVKQEGDT